MEDNTPTPAIYAAMVKVMDDVSAIRKDSKNHTQGFMFRGIEAAMQALHPAFVKHGVFVTPEVLSSSEIPISSKSGTQGWRVVLQMRFTFFATDGSSVTAVTSGEAMDYADKATNKAMSVALKYALFQTFMVPTEEAANDDTDNHSPEAVREYPDGQPVNDVGKDEGATQPQQRMFHGITKSLGTDMDELAARMQKKFGVDKFSELTKKQASFVLDTLKEEQDAQ